VVVMMMMMMMMVMVMVVVVDTRHCSVDTDELFHAYFFYDLIPPTISEISENYLRKSKYRSTGK
jgi:hypothetical protein